MTKEQLILLLKNYKENKAKLKLKLREKESILRKIESLKNVSLSVTSYEENSGIHSKNIISDKTGNKASKNVDIETNYNEDLERIENEIKELETKLEEINIRLEVLKKRNKDILIKYYVEQNTYQELAEEYKMSMRGIQKIVKKATEKMTNI